MFWTYLTVVVDSARASGFLFVPLLLKCLRIVCVTVDEQGIRESCDKHNIKTRCCSCMMVMNYLNVLVGCKDERSIYVAQHVSYYGTFKCCNYFYVLRFTIRDIQYVFCVFHSENSSKAASTRRRIASMAKWSSSPAATPASVRRRSWSWPRAAPTCTWHAVTQRSATRRATRSSRAPATVTCTRANWIWRRWHRCGSLPRSEWTAFGLQLWCGFLGVFQEPFNIYIYNPAK